MRSLFLYLSTNRQLKRWSSRSWLAQAAARRFIAGERIEHTLGTIRSLSKRGMTATVDHLGENTDTESQAIAAGDAYLIALDRLFAASLQSHISVKLTQLGLDLGTDFCRENVARVAARAQEIGTFMRIDMEGSDYTDRTLGVLFALRQEFDNVGIVIQAYLYRSRGDITSMIKAGIPVRLCKGAYNEPATIAFPRKVDVDQNTIDLMHMLLSTDARKNGALLAMATHDEKLIQATKTYAAAHHIPKSEFEFQMLFGVRPALQQQLADQGYGMRVYIPYGQEWYPYYMRRLAERPANVWFIVSNLFRK